MKYRWKMSVLPTFQLITLVFCSLILFIALYENWPPRTNSGKKNVSLDGKKASYLAMTKTNDDFNGPGTPQDDRTLVNIVSREFIHRPAAHDKPYKLKNPELKDFSRGQSRIIDNLFKGKRNGFYVECGALDGEGRSNSLFFERERAWQGLLIEADPSNYRQLRERNRKAYTINACLSVVPYAAKMKFNPAQNMGRVFLGQKEETWARNHGLKVQPITLQCFPLYTMMKALNRTTIDFFSLDVEGSEMDVLKTIPFDKLDIKSLTVEFIHGEGNAKTQSLQSFMESKGYTRIGKVHASDGSANDLLFAKNSFLKEHLFHAIS